MDEKQKRKVYENIILEMAQSNISTLRKSKLDGKTMVKIAMVTAMHSIQSILSAHSNGKSIEELRNDAVVLMIAELMGWVDVTGVVDYLKRITEETTDINAN